MWKIITLTKVNGFVKCKSLLYECVELSFHCIININLMSDESFCCTCHLYYQISITCTEIMIHSSSLRIYNTMFVIIKVGTRTMNIITLD